MEKASPTKTRPVHIRTRKASPGCRQTYSTPAPHARYRESNSSRLRQELKGMTISGVVRQSRVQSPLRGSTNSSPARSITSECLSPKKHDSERTLDLISTPRTMSDTSNASRDIDRCKVTASATCGYLVDTRSKTLNTVNQSSSDRETSVKKGSYSPSQSGVGIRSNIASGYGKPLVTPINKRLSIRRDFALQGSVPNGTSGKSPIVCRAKSPAKSWKVENRAPFTTSPANSHTAKSRILTPKVDVITSILLHIILWRFAHIASFFLHFKTWPSGVAIIVLGVLFWTAIKETPSGNSLRASNTSPNVRRERIAGSVSATPKPKRPLSSSIQRPSKSPAREERFIEKLPARTKQSPASKFKHPMTEPKEKKPIECPSPPRVSRIPMSLRNPSTEKLKQQFYRDMPVFAAGRPSSTNHSTRSFKPQLEDIKSSYLLLSKTTPETPKTTVESEKVTNPLPKPKLIDEAKRKEQLEDIKRKFQSKNFFVNSKYDKIEGLNWISWK